MRVQSSGPAASFDPAGLDGLLPGAGPDFGPAFLLAALRRHGQAWLGRARLRQLATALGATDTDAVALLDRIPKPPPALGDANFWHGRKIPLLHGGRVVWADLFWRPDRAGWARGLGSFALRLNLPHAGLVELRGRVEETRLDAVMHLGALSRQAAYDATEGFREILARLGLQGELSVRDASNNGRP